MPFKKENLNSFTLKDNKLILEKDYLDKNLWRFKKITGTRLCAILGINHYKSPFKLWTEMVNLYYEEMDKTLADTGNYIEPKLKEFAEQKLNNKYITHDLKTVNFDCFKSVSKIFGGVPDGEPLIAGKVDYSTGLPMLEIKTSSVDKFEYKNINGKLTMQFDTDNLPKVKSANEKMNSWFENGQIIIPIEYKYQLGLYLYLRNIEKGMFVVGFLTREDYVYPEKFNPNNRNIYMVEMKINRSEFEDTIKLAEKWWNDYIINGISPEMTENDKLWYFSEIKR